MNADEASAWLKIPKSTLYKLCSDGEVPAAKVGRHWRFHRDTLERWLLEPSPETPGGDNPRKRVRGSAKGQVWIAPDFDAPLPDATLREFHQ